MNRFRDVELLSAYLDGQLDPADSARLESRISLEPELASTLTDLRLARGTLRKLPLRKAPRNFTLSRMMVGSRPPLPRSYSVFRFSSAFATVLLVLTFAANTLVPRVGFGAAAPATNFGYGGGGSPGMGGGCAEPCGFAPSQQIPVATQMLEEPAAAEAPSMGESMAPTATQLPALAEDAAREAATSLPDTVVPKEAEAGQEGQFDVPTPAGRVVPGSWQIAILGIALASTVIAIAIRRSAKRKWS